MIVKQYFQITSNYNFQYDNVDSNLHRTQLFIVDLKPCSDEYTGY